MQYHVLHAQGTTKLTWNFQGEQKETTQQVWFSNSEPVQLSKHGLSLELTPLKDTS